MLFVEGIRTKQSLSASMSNDSIFAPEIHVCNVSSRLSMERSEVASNTPNSVTYLLSSSEQFKETLTTLFSGILIPSAISLESNLAAFV